MSVAKFVYADYFVTVLAETKEKKKIVALLSGGLDSTLAIKTMQKQGFEVSAVAIKTPFCDFDCGRGCGFEIREKADNLGVNLKTVYLGDEYIEMLKHPKHGFGSGMNPCIDCRAMMFEAGKKHMEEIGAEFIISGEVLGQRPMSQFAPALKKIEKLSNLEGKIVRPLSAALLPATDPEKNGLIKRKDLGMIRGRSRKEQLKMAKEFGIEDPPNAGGGCLLTDPAFSLRAIDLFKHIETPTTNDIDLLKIGRHFRLDQNTKLIVGRNKDENEIMHALALSNDILLEAKEHVGPTTLLRGNGIEKHIEFSAKITLRYSDAPKNETGVVTVHKNEGVTEISVDCAEEISYTQFRI
ncbi:MAG: tRNA (5-methylaminomethyl-2-thiouridylate)-methyltransferase [Candidatus Nitrosopelagicus sp.]|jgi:tRNA U34 2-thiouridine synthase MnmA/TrmU|nr:tRNA (5-methylaminomethyl-2-thiouridylate)-methyltransferase [Candidatus Nitrosopelagicus sp.]|tara:strand:- start:2866 stop:3924 length:1059 start_codon:yes stop_codon:yes gene_type:complete